MSQTNVGRWERTQVGVELAGWQAQVWENCGVEVRSPDAVMLELDALVAPRISRAE